MKDRSGRPTEGVAGIGWVDPAGPGAEVERAGILALVSCLDYY